MKSTTKYWLLLIASIILLGQSCAIIQSPTGGPRDTSPPKIKKSDPISGTTSFEGNSIALDFDEFVVLNNLNQELIVSPPLKHKPDFKIKGKSLFISFRDTLEENTTYTFNLGTGIKDYHEGVVLDSNIIVFSTGNSIDSGKVIGSVQDAFTLKPINNTLVMLYSDFADSIPAKEKPFYYSKSKKSGEFLIDYLKHGQYQLFVLEDKNNNFKYDLPNERIGFSDSKINVGDTLQELEYVKVHLFREFISNQFFVGSEIKQYGKILLGFNQPLKSLSLKVLNGDIKSNWYLPEYDLEKDTVWIWTNLEVEEGQSLEIEISDNGVTLDTIELKLKPKPSTEKGLLGLKPSIKIKEKSGIVKYFEDLKITSSNPIIDLNIKGIIIRENDTVGISLNSSGFDEERKEFTLPIKLKQESNYTLYIYKNSFTDIFGLTNDTMKFEFKTLSDIEYASLEVKVENASGSPKIIQLTTESNEEVIRELTVTDGRKIEFTNLSPGKYKLKMIFDNNSNRKWDSGSFIPRKNPERVIYFSDQIEMKEGWDKKITWIIPE
ncbi:MAG: Ig-like domain-containing protein [Flavobacteriales bacterium]